MTITYGDPAYPHFTEWVDALATTTLPQGIGRLVTINEVTGVVEGYCCLGQGCTVMNEIPRRSRTTDEISREVDWDPAGSFFGWTELAPPEFHVWLGLDEPDGEDNIAVAMPEEYGVQGRLITEEPIKVAGHQASVTLTCAAMNDQYLLTFSQIADVLRYFGIK